MPAVADVRDIARIAYGFKASKALLAALEFNIFGKLAISPRSLAELAGETGLAANRLETLLTALASLGLVVLEDGVFRNAPACQDYLVPGKPAYFGDYFTLQTDRFIYPAFNELAAVIRGDARSEKWGEYQALMQDPEAADVFSRGQHSGSLGPAIALARQVDLSTRRRLLDVGGGSGAFAIMLCRRNPRLEATILDFPNAVKTAQKIVAEAGLEGRIQFVEGDASLIPWPENHDTVLMSYLLSAVAGVAIDSLLTRAYAALPQGGMLIVHDFMVDDDKTGPPAAALWLLTCMFNDGEAVVLTPRMMTDWIAQAGFRDIAVADLIPGLTRVALAFKHPGAMA